MYFHKLKLFHVSFILCKIVKRLPGLKSKTKEKKEKSKNLFSNIKLLIFIPYAKIDSFFKLIKNKYNKSYSDFFIYFENYYLSSKKFSKVIWNYCNIIFNNLNNNIIFFTNNICESFNMTLNKKYIGYCKAMYYFKKSIFILKIFIKCIVNIRKKYIFRSCFSTLYENK